jgi:hypothetical protein
MGSVEMYKKVRLVPKSPFGRVDAEKLAESLKWTHYETVEGGEGAPHEVIWISADRGAAVHWIEDNLVRVKYFLVKGGHPGPTVDLLRSHVDVHDSRSLQEAFDGTRDSGALMDGLHMLGAHCSGVFDAELFALFRWALHDPDPLVRRVALLTVAMTSWREVLPLLDYIRKDDPVASVRAQAETVFDVMKSRTDSDGREEEGKRKGEGGNSK